MKPYAVLLTTLIVSICVALMLTPTPVKPTTLTRPPADTPTTTCTLRGESGTETVTGTVAFQQGQGHVYYVAKNGNDSNPGTEEDPWRTIMHGSSQIGAGDTLYIEDGTYTEGLRGLPSGTSWNNPVTIAAYPGHTVTINGAWYGYTVYMEDAQYIILDGLILDGVNTSDTSETLGIFRSHHIRVQNCEIKNCRVSNVYMSGTGYNEFINCSIHDAGTGTGRGYGIYIKADHCLIDGCDIYDNAGYGIHIWYSGGSSNYNTVRNCKLYDNGLSPHYAHASGIGIFQGTENVAYNNITWGNRHAGIYVDYGATDTRLYNNTCYDNDTYGIHIDAGDAEEGDVTGTIVRNNICYANHHAQIDDDAADTILSNNLTTAPHFVDSSVYDFHLRPTSPAIDAGYTISSVPNDFDGVSRPQGAGYDIGAYESPFSTRITDLRVIDAIGDTPILTVTLRWTTPALAVTYSLRSSNTLLTMANWDDSPVVTVPFTASEPGSSEWLTTPVDYSGGILYLALRSQNSAGGWSKISNNAFWPHIDVYLPLIMKDYVPSSQDS